MNGSVLPEDVLRDAPTYTPRPHELADLELLLSGAYAPLTGFLGRADLTAVRRRGRLADGTPWPVAVTCEIPAEMATGSTSTIRGRRTVMLTDPEGAPVAAIEVTDAWPTSDGLYAIGGTVRRMGDGGHGPFQRLRRTPEEVRALLPPGRVLGVIADRPLHRPQLAQIAHAARTLAAHLLIIVPVTGPGPDGLPPEALVRAIFAARDRMPPATIVAVPLMPRGDEMRDALLRARVAQAYGVTHVLSTGEMLSGGGLRVLVPRELAYDNRDGQWRWRDDIPPRNRRLAMTTDEIDDLLDRGFPLPEWHTPPAVARELARVRPPRRLSRPGRVLHRLVRVRQVHHRPRPGRLAAGDRRAHHHAARRRRGAARAVRRARLQQGRPGPQRPPDRLGRRRGGPAPRDGHRLPDRAVRRAPARRAGGWPWRPAPASCWCTWPRRSRCASGATARACTPGPGPASCAA